MATLSHVMMVECVQEFGPGVSIPMVVLYNRNMLSQKAALDSVNSGEFNRNVLCIPRSQYFALFEDIQDG